MIGFFKNCSRSKKLKDMIVIIIRVYNFNTNIFKHLQEFILISKRGKTLSDELCFFKIIYNKNNIAFFWPL